MAALTAIVARTAANASRVDALANDAAAVAERSGVLVGEVVETMATISAASARIVDITGVIDSIAFQTNLLALIAESAQQVGVGRELVGMPGRRSGRWWPACAR